MAKQTVSGQSVNDRLKLVSDPPKLVKKISSKIIKPKLAADLVALLPDEESIAELAYFYGEISDFVTGTGDYGDWVKYKGNFNAVVRNDPGEDLNVWTGVEAVYSREIILPGGYGDMFQTDIEAVYQAAEFDPSAKDRSRKPLISITFGMMIGAKKHASQKHEWVIDPISTGIDRTEQLRNQGQLLLGVKA